MVPLGSIDFSVKSTSDSRIDLRRLQRQISRRNELALRRGPRRQDQRHIGQRHAQADIAGADELGVRNPG